MLFQRMRGGEGRIRIWSITLLNQYLHVVGNRSGMLWMIKKLIEPASLGGGRGLRNECEEYRNKVGR